MPDTYSQSIAVIGGGLAGLAAAEAVCRHGLRVELFEQATRLGGRAGSFVEPFDNQLVDFSQHAAMGCCTNFLDFCRRTGVADCFRREKNLHFIGPDNELCEFAPARWLPAPFHLLTSLKRLNFLTPSERSGIVRSLKKLACEKGPTALAPGPSPKGRGKDCPCRSETEMTFGDWLRGREQSENAVQNIWSVIIHGALCETIEHVSLSAARKVFVDGFLASRAAGEMWLPTMPLAEIFDDRVGKRLTDRGVTIHRRARAMWIECEENARLSLVLAEGDARSFDAVVLAVPWHQAGGLFPPAVLEDLPELAAAQNLVSGAIAAVHLWFNRPITPLPHAILVGKLSQWIFQCTPECDAGCHAHAGRGHEGDAEHDSHAHDERGHGTRHGTRPSIENSAFHYQVVISAAHRLSMMENDALRERVLEELAEAFPSMKSARLLHSRVIVQPHAVFSMQPGVDRHRPAQTTALSNLFLAGDWTHTGWPATMEGAVRSGYLAAEALLQSLGRSPTILAADLPRGFFASRIIS
jgi:uncharacterized protein with NAD-binding domain and iron-sulfur cluster